MPPKNDQAAAVVDNDLTPGEGEQGAETAPEVEAQEPLGDAGSEDAAEVEADAAPALEEPMPAEISGQIGHETRESAAARVDTFFAEARYFLSNLHYEFDGETGEILAFLRQKLRP